MKIPYVILMGSSQGAKTVIDFTLEHPEYTKALILVAPSVSGFIFTGNPPLQTPQIEKAEKKGDLDQVNELELQIWVDGPNRGPELVDTQVRELARDMNRIALSTPLNLGNEIPLEPTAVNRLGEIHVPTLILVGNMDRPRTLACADFLERHIPGAKKVVMHGVAHLLNMENPQVFNQHVNAFLERL
jgi:3-oxoadipate enol-lactonase